MSKLRYSEMFYSVQGEGKFVGVPSIFLRTFGCNFRCRAFGRTNVPADEKINPDVQQVINNLDQYKTFTDLPLVRTGCDTYASIYPEFSKLMNYDSVDDVVDKMLQLTPDDDWYTSGGQDVHLVVTGGEPLLPKWQRFWPEMLSHERMSSLQNLTFETNGTQPLTDEFVHYLSSRQDVQITWSLRPKPSESGEDWREAIQPHIVKKYFTVTGSKGYLKFVVKDITGLEEVNRAVVDYRHAGVTVPVYIMPVGGCVEEYNENAPKVAAMAMNYGYRYSPREHLTLFGNAWNTQER